MTGRLRDDSGPYSTTSQVPFADMPFLTDRCDVDARDVAWSSRNRADSASEEADDRIDDVCFDRNVAPSRGVTDG